MGKDLDLSRLPHVFRGLPKAFAGTRFLNECQVNCWSSNFWVSTQFQNVVCNSGETLDSFMRSPRWLIVYRNRNIIFISPFEANHLINRLKSSRSSGTTLRLLLPRIKRNQSTIVNNRFLSIPSSIDTNPETEFYQLPTEWLVQLFVFNGSLYFATADEQNAYCRFLSVCPRPRTPSENMAFEEGYIDKDGFISNIHPRFNWRPATARFRSNPIQFIKRLIEIRNNCSLSSLSHVGSIILKCQKLLE